MSYHCQEEVGRLIENAAQWMGDGAAVRTSASLWERLLRELRRGSGSVAVVGIDAGYTRVALTVIGEDLAKALITFHTSSLTVTMQAREVLGIGRRTYQERLTRGHVEFMRAYHEARRGSTLAGHAPVAKWGA